MNFLEAIKKNPISFKNLSLSDKNSELKDKGEDNQINIDECFIENSKDSHIIYWSEYIFEFWKEFVDDTLLFDFPLLKKHHTGHKNFLNEVTQFINNHLVTELTMIEIESESEYENYDDLNIIDEMYINKIYY